VVQVALISSNSIFLSRPDKNALEQILEAVELRASVFGLGVLVILTVALQLTERLRTDCVTLFGRATN
jgi:hypothetical protein